MSSQSELDTLSVNTIRTLSIDAVQKAKSGHPGTPMALAPLVYTLWNRVMRFDPQDPIWPNRDRFVLSNGHASMLLWSALHLSGTRAVNAEYERLGAPSVTLDDLRRFRQLDSKAPGHPEYHWVSGVETTTGPLGQGVATSVGMAMAEKWLESRYNRPGLAVFDYDLYAIAGDGCLMEGVGSEAASLAGHLGLDNLCWVYDDKPHHHRGRHAPRLHRGRGGPVPRLRLERAARGRRQRSPAHRARPRGVPRDQEPADAHHPGEPHRLRLAQQAGHLGGARRAARR
jgi:transketolase